MGGVACLDMRSNDDWATVLLRGGMRRIHKVMAVCLPLRRRRCQVLIGEEVYMGLS